MQVCARAGDGTYFVDQKTQPTRTWAADTQSRVSVYGIATVTTFRYDRQRSWPMAFYKFPTGCIELNELVSLMNTTD